MVRQSNGEHMPIYDHSLAHQSRISQRQPKTAGVDHTAAITLSIISNSQLLREGLPRLLTPYFPLELLDTYPGEPVIQPPPSPENHVILLDSRIGAEMAREWIRLWREQKPPGLVVIMEMLNEIDCIVDCIAAGACAYVLQGASIGDLADAIMQVRRGTARCSPEVTAHLFARLEAAEKAVARFPQLSDSTPLTNRENEVLELIAKGYTNKEIAARLVIALHTVKHHVHNILEKLELSQRSDAANLALYRGWIKE